MFFESPRGYSLVTESLVGWLHYLAITWGMISGHFDKQNSTFFGFVPMQAKQFKYEENEIEINYEKRNKIKEKVKWKIEEAYNSSI